jgi:hypothetical protein
MRRATALTLMFVLKSSLAIGESETSVFERGWQAEELTVHAHVTSMVINQRANQDIA